MNYQFDHYIALDWSQKVMAFARLTRGDNALEEKQGPSDLKELRSYLQRLKGSKILTLEESTGSQWLYTELRSSVSELLVCDPFRNHLLAEGPKTDRIDARKLVTLLKANLLKPVFHSGDELIYIRKLVSGYQDVIQAGVRLKNQKKALLRSCGGEITRDEDRFVLQGLEERIETHEKEKTRFTNEFHRLMKIHPVLRHLETIPGIGEINAVKIAAIVVDPTRFEDDQHLWSYAGLIRHERMSGGRSYGKKKPRYSRVLKSVFKTAALSVAYGKRDNSLRDYYEYLMNEKSYPAFQARHALARKIASVTLAVMKNKKNYQEKYKNKDQILN
jgi:transposase